MVEKMTDHSDDELTARHDRRATRARPVTSQLPRDEPLPFLGVFRGDMSIVDPAPQRVAGRHGPPVIADDTAPLYRVKSRATAFTVVKHSNGTF